MNQSAPEIWDTCQACQGEGSTEEHRPHYDDPDFCVVIKCQACGGSGWEQVQ